MRVRYYYLVTPNSDILSLTNEMDMVAIETMLKPQLWESDEGGRGDWSTDDYIAKAKIAFLTNLKTENSASYFVRRLLSGKISINIFDRFWTIERVELAGNTNEFSECTLSLDEIEFCGNPVVDEWMASIAKKSGKLHNP